MPSRRPYIDWLRGVAVLCMIEWHVLDGWTMREGRDRGLWIFIETIGGFAAPLFMFVAGVAIPFAMASRQRKGDSLVEASWKVQKRGWQVLGIAHLFRFQSFLLNPYGTWSGIFRPDILNILGLGMAGTSWLCSRAVATGRRYWWLLLPAVVIFALTPYTRVWWWPAQLPGRLEAYIRPGNGLGVFQIFPWTGYVPFGALLGSMLNDARDDAAERRMLGWFALGGGIAAAIGAAGYFIDYTRPSAFWLDPYSSLLLRSGLMTLALAVSKWLVALQPQAMLNPILRFGQTSLFVYMVHVELAYGVWSYPIQKTMPFPVALAALLGMYVLMYWAAGWWEGREKRTWIPGNLQPTTGNQQFKA